MNDDDYLDLDIDPARPTGKAGRRRRRRGSASPAPTVSDEFSDHVEFVELWLAPTIARRLTGSKGLNWCPQWWRHREVSIRLYVLWRAWETARTQDDSAMANWWVNHADPHLRVILDGESGPMYRCLTHHQNATALFVTPVPDDWFGHGLDPDPGARRRRAYLPGPTPPEPTNPDDKPRQETFASVVEWVEVWLAPTITRRFGKSGHTWCAQWWRHQELAVRFHALWRAWEAANHDAGTAPSTWWVHALDPQLRIVLDAATGPLYRCTPAVHASAAPLTTTPPAAGWFDQPLVGTNPTFDPFGGFGPDPRVVGPAEEVA